MAQLPLDPELPEPEPEVLPVLPESPVPEVPLLPEPVPEPEPEPLLPVLAGTGSEVEPDDPPPDPELFPEPELPELEPEPELVPDPLDRPVPPEEPDPDAVLTVPPGLTTTVPADPVEPTVTGSVPVPVSEPSWLLPGVLPSEPPGEAAEPCALADGREPGVSPPAGDRPPAIPVDGAVPPPADAPDDDGFGIRPPATGVC